MSNQQRFVESMLAVAGIWLLFQHIPDYGATLWEELSAELLDGHRPLTVIRESVHFLASVLTGWLLIAKRKPVARWLYPEPDTSGQGVNLPIVSTGTAIIAIYFVVQGLVALGTYYSPPEIIGGEATLFKGIVSIVCGVVFFILAPWIGRLWKKMEARVVRGA